MSSEQWKKTLLTVPRSLLPLLPVTCYLLFASPKVIEDGLTAGMLLMGYLTADGYRLSTPLCSMKLRVPGEYDGSETHLPHGVFPTVRIQASAAFRKYLREKVKIEFEGVDQSDGLIAEVYDEASETTDDIATILTLLLCSLLTALCSLIFPPFTKPCRCVIIKRKRWFETFRSAVPGFKQVY